MMFSFTTMQDFDGNVNATHVTEVTLDASGILTRFIRIYPINCVGEDGTRKICSIQFEILGWAAGIDGFCN